MIKLRTNRCLFISLIIWGLTFIIASLTDFLGIHNEYLIFLAIALLFGFWFNLLGLVFAFVEFKKDKNKALIGLFGNFAFVIALLAIAGYAMYTIDQVGNY